MIAGAIAISRAEASASEQGARSRAVRRECDRYGLDATELEASLRGELPRAAASRRPWWEALIVLGALAVFAWLATEAAPQPIGIHVGWAALLVAASLVLLAVGAVALWRRTRFA
jgi:hypothetical protein